ncbi:hypothetical protein IMCC3317_25920 [Kordia antarctica]|uniref:Uncharacterized protein n=1 Tax=Kordia antarctica TaxID=1218801 RepID=A0A7L4ZMT2_9FLAO|nr:hypothetical protein IMCC3317_25920 [Kordia antarctica]
MPNIDFTTTLFGNWKTRTYKKTKTNDALIAYSRTFRKHKSRSNTLL